MLSAFLVAVPLHGQAVRHGQASADVLGDARAASVVISVQTDSGPALGSGFFIDSTGIIATAAHVVRGATSVEVRLANGFQPRVLGLLYADSATDFALIQVAMDHPPVLASGSDALTIGERLYAVGSPEGLAFSVSDGLLSSQRLVAGRRLLQVSIPVSHGSSGGPVVDPDGRVVGMIVLGLRGDGAENLNFALPVSYIREVLPLVRGQTPRPFASD
ncbi:MAG TPA: serine protease, partial [Gemmatimonadaceae bacterium]|nr:serine protease [Gemmatimonadaceae bacterium]